jgi:murein DD-endopeptidase MepM/ murein hydrolase activator NlpD
LKTRKTFSSWLTNKYLLVIRNEENFAEKTTLSFNYAKLIVFITTSLIILFSLSFYLSSTVLAKWFHPASREMELNRQLIELAATVDSLAGQLNYRDKQLMNIGHVIKGEDSYLASGNKRTSTEADSSEQAEEEPMDEEMLAAMDGALRAEFENGEMNVVRTANTYTHDNPLQSVFLFPPIAGGIVLGKFDSKIGHYGLDIVAKKDEPVKCVADGTVITSAWTNDTGYVITVQHPGNLVSVYKHNSVLLKKEGAVVRAGEIIALIGNSGEITSGPHLHFELWYNGNPVNPEMFVSF